MERVSSYARKVSGILGLTVASTLSPSMTQAQEVSKITEPEAVQISEMVTEKVNSVVTLSDNTPLADSVRESISSVLIASVPQKSHQGPE